MTHDLKDVGSNLVSSNILDRNGVKAMSGSIQWFNLKIQKNIISQMGFTDKKYFKKTYLRFDLENYKTPLKYGLFDTGVWLTCARMLQN